MRRGVFLTSAVQSQQRGSSRAARAFPTGTSNRWFSKTTNPDKETQPSAQLEVQSQEEWQARCRWAGGALGG